MCYIFARDRFQHLNKARADHVDIDKIEEKCYLLYFLFHLEDWVRIFFFDIKNDADAYLKSTHFFIFP